MRVTILEKTSAFKRFGGPIQLASNALQILKEMDSKTYDQIMGKFTFTGDKENGIKDGIRDEWYAKFDLAGPAEARGLPYTGVIERPDLQVRRKSEKRSEREYLESLRSSFPSLTSSFLGQEIFLDSLAESAPTRGIDGESIVKNGNGVESYTKHESGEVTVKLEDGGEMTGDVLIGADGIWSSVRATMRDEPVRGDAAGVSYVGERAPEERTTEERSEATSIMPRSEYTRSEAQILPRRSAPRFRRSLCSSFPLVGRSVTIIIVASSLRSSCTPRIMPRR